MIAGANKIQEMLGGLDVRRNGVAQIGIEIGEARAVYDQVERTRQAHADIFFQAKPGLTYIAFDHIDLFAENSAKPRTVLFLQTVKRWGFRDNFFKAPFRGSIPVAADQKGDSADVRNLLEQVYHPDFAYKSGYTDEQNVFSSECLTHAEAVHAGRAFKWHNCGRVYKSGAAGVLWRGRKLTALPQT